MIRKYVLPVLALIGVVVAIFAAARSAKVTPPALPVTEAPRPPYPTFVAGAGIVEANTENIAIGTHIAGIVSRIHVHLGDCVKTGTPLFSIDDRATRAEMTTRQAAVQIADADFADATYELNLAEKLANDNITSVELRDRSRYAVQRAAAQLAQARANLKSAETEFERLTVGAPVDGQILQLKVHPGEFAPAGVLQQPLILLGGTAPLHVRVDVDENDAWRVHVGALAIGYLRGNKEIRSALRFVRFEPYVVPKKSLTGESTERVDTRVLQVIFSFERDDLPAFVGQQMDVFIDAPERLAKDPAPADVRP